MSKQTKKLYSTFTTFSFILDKGLSHFSLFPFKNFIMHFVIRCLSGPHMSIVAQDCKSHFVSKLPEIIHSLKILFKVTWVLPIKSKSCF